MARAEGRQELKQMSASTRESAKPLSQSQRYKELLETITQAGQAKGHHPKHSQLAYANVADLGKREHLQMLKAEQMLASTAASEEAPKLPFRPLKVIVELVGKQ
ncbi:hypothetical protein Baya_0309 [Bagarius yarrelli]|uniref:Uncharacterized protein n=1 Tax=Bagarius yarrelli TaxID=175774 RepID=A0A556THW1_BAGYA|nr:hypothetical protein Baya_0309 [Bagarius yarrelli]